MVFLSFTSQFGRVKQFDLEVSTDLEFGPKNPKMANSDLKRIGKKINTKTIKKGQRQGPQATRTQISSFNRESERSRKFGFQTREIEFDKYRFEGLGEIHVRFLARSFDFPSFRVVFRVRDLSRFSSSSQYDLEGKRRKREEEWR